MILFSRSKNGGASARTARGLFTFLFVLLFCAASNAAAGYGPVGGVVREGGGTWGSILEMSAEFRGPDIVFTVRRQDGMPMYPESRVSIRVGSWRGGDVASGTVASGSRSVTLTAPAEGKTQSYYACISNSYGHAWVGPLKLGGYDGADGYESDRPGDVGMEMYPPEPSSGSGGVGRPRIASWPDRAWVDEQIRIAVTAGWCRNGGLVRLRCVAEGADKAYKSDWIRTGDTVEVPFRFRSPGKKRISCVTLDSCCASPEVSRFILVEERNRRPYEPRISSKPAEVKLKVPAHIPVLPGEDPDGDQVKVECEAEDARPFSSGWFNSPQWTDAVFTFEQPGSKRIFCRTLDRRGAFSRTVERMIEVTAPVPPLMPSKGETRINISVVTKPDGTADSRVSVENSRSEGCAPFCDGDITYDKPYLPEPYYYGPEQQPVYEP